jgi:hypothetical protein
MGKAYLRKPEGEIGRNRGIFAARLKMSKNIVMRSGLQKRPFTRLAEREPDKPSDAKPRSKFDTWLQRSAQIAQITLVIAAISGYFYSVRPIHQKQRLDEEIAEKTIELAAVQSRVHSTYSSLRKFVVFDFRRFVYAQCTGLLDIPKTNPYEAHWVALLKRDVSACILKEGADTHKLDNLATEDLALLKAELQKIAERVSTLSTAANAEVARVQQVPVDTLAPAPTPQPGTYSAAIEDLMRQSGRPVDPNSPSSRLTAALEKVASQYMDDVGAELGKINEIRWDGN